MPIWVLTPEWIRKEAPTHRKWIGHSVVRFHSSQLSNVLHGRPDSGQGPTVLSETRRVAGIPGPCHHSRRHIGVSRSKEEPSGSATHSLTLHLPPHIIHTPSSALQEDPVVPRGPQRTTWAMKIHTFLLGLGLWLQR